VEGNYTQHAAGTIAIEVASPASYDQLAVSGNVRLGGALTVSLVGGFVPSLGQSFPIIDSLSNVLSDTFDAEQYPLFNGLTFDVVYSGGSAILQVVEIGLPGDFNGDGFVDSADYAVWRDGLGATHSQADYHLWRANFGQGLGVPGDFNADGRVDAADFVVWRKGLGTRYTQDDYAVWRGHFGQTASSGAELPGAVPEPNATLLAMSFSLVLMRRRRQDCYKACAPHVSPCFKMALE
jgi:hypothetical protein